MFANHQFPSEGQPSPNGQALICHAGRATNVLSPSATSSRPLCNFRKEQ